MDRETHMNKKYLEQPSERFQLKKNILNYLLLTHPRIDQTKISKNDIKLYAQRDSYEKKYLKQLSERFQLKKKMQTIYYLTNPRKYATTHAFLWLACTHMYKYIKVK